MFKKTGTDSPKLMQLLKEVTKRKINDPIKTWTKELNRHFSKEDIQMANKYVKRCSTSLIISSVQFSCSVMSLCDPMDCSTPGFSVHHQLPELTQTHGHWVGYAIQLSHPLSSPSFPAFHRSQHQGIFQWISSSHQVAKVLELQLQHQSFQWIFRTDFL